MFPSFYPASFEVGISAGVLYIVVCTQPKLSMAAAWLRCPNYPKLALQLLPGREVPPTSCRPCVLIYTDAACEPNMLVGVAVVAFCQMWPKPKAGFLNVPREWLDFLLPRQTQINQAECLAVVLTINNLRPFLERADMWRFIGNLLRIVPQEDVYSQHQCCCSFVLYKGRIPAQLRTCPQQSKHQLCHVPRGLGSFAA